MFSLRDVKLTDRAVLVAKRSVAIRASGREIGADGKLVACRVKIETNALRVARPRSPGEAFTQRCAVVKSMKAASARSTQPIIGGYLLAGANAIIIPPRTKPSHPTPSRPSPTARKPFLTCVIVLGLFMFSILRESSNRLTLRPLGRCQSPTVCWPLALSSGYRQLCQVLTLIQSLTNPAL